MRILLCLLLFSVSVAFGAVEIENVTFGFSDGYKTGTWAPLTVTVRNQNELSVFVGELAVEVRNFSSDIPLERYITPLRLGPTERQQSPLSVYCSKSATRLVIELRPRTAGQGVYNPVAFQEILLPTPIARKDYFLLMLVPSGDKLKQLIDKKVLKASDDAQVHIKYLPNREALRHYWIDYSAVDVLVIRETFLTERHVPKAKQTALLDWVRRGGTLIMSGGGSFNAVRAGFVEPYLPVELKGLKRVDTFSDALYAQLGLQFVNGDGILFERIDFAPRAECETLIGTDEQIYVAKRDFGDGQILCLSFDYNVSQFSEQEIGEAFWQHLLGKYGKSPRHLADRAAFFRQHEEKIYRQFLSKMPTQVPLIKLLAVVLPVYLLVFGGFLLCFRRFKQKSSIYWMGGCLFILIATSTIAVARHIFPNDMVVDRFSILSVYPEQRAHLQSFVFIRSTTRTKTFIEFPEGTFIRQQEIGLSQPTRTLIQGSRAQLQDVFLDPWSPTVYVREAFTQHRPVRLENAWRITNKDITYLGDIGLRAQYLFGTENRIPIGVNMRRQSLKIPPDKELKDARKIFARILQQEGVLQYLTTGTNLDQEPCIIGWTSQEFADMVTDGSVHTNDETLVIFRSGPSL